MCLYTPSKDTVQDILNLTKLAIFMSHTVSGSFAYMSVIVTGCILRIGMFQETICIAYDHANRGCCSNDKKAETENRYNSAGECGQMNLFTSRL